MKMLALAATIATALSASAAMAGSGSYSGNWLVTVSHALRSDGTYCLTLTDDGSDQFRHSGEATSTNFTDEGTFQVINGLLVATIPAGTGTGELESFIFTGRATNGNISAGEYEEAYGDEVDSGVTKFTRNGC